MCDIAIHSNSQAAIEALNSNVVNPKFIWGYWCELIQIDQKDKFSSIKVLVIQELKETKRQKHLLERVPKHQTLALNYFVA